MVITLPKKTVTADAMTRPNGTRGPILRMGKSTTLASGGFFNGVCVFSKLPYTNNQCQMFFILGMVTVPWWFVK